MSFSDSLDLSYFTYINRENQKLEFEDFISTHVASLGHSMTLSQAYSVVQGGLALRIVLPPSLPTSSYRCVSSCGAGDSLLFKQ